MERLAFEWDESKDRVNQRKHGISFSESRGVFFDDLAVEFYDDKHSDWGNRFLLLGMSPKKRVLLVCHCMRQGGSVIRIISARKASSSEKKLYPGA